MATEVIDVMAADVATPMSLPIPPTATNPSIHSPVYLIMTHLISHLMHTDVTLDGSPLPGTGSTIISTRVWLYGHIHK